MEIETVAGEEEAVDKPMTKEWGSIQAWLEQLGPEALIAMNETLDTDPSYDMWLLEQLCIEDADAEAAEYCNLTQLRASALRNVGYRAVSVAGMIQKMQDIASARAWRDWDICTLAEPVPEEAVTAAAAAEAAQCTNPKPMYVKFHHRGVALHMLCQSFRDRVLDLPPWLQKMARKIRVAWCGQLTQVERFARGLAATASMEHGTVKLSWLDIVLQVAGGSEALGQSLQSRVFAICPEHASKLNDWKNLKTLSTRVTPAAYALVEKFMQREGMIVPPLPQSWLREPYMLLKGRKSGPEALSPDEQFAAYARILGHLKSVAEAAALKLSDPGTPRELVRRVPEETRKRLVVVARKYVRGMAAAESATGLCFDSLQHRFVSGEFDTIVLSTSSPSVAAKFWPWVKEAVTAKQDEESRAQQAALEKKAAEAMVHAERLVAEAAENHAKTTAECHDLVKGERELWLTKLQKAFRSQLEVYAQKHRIVVEELWKKAEEKVVLSQDAKHQQEASLSAPAVLVPLRRKSSLTAAIVEAARLAPLELPRVVLLDLSITSWTSAEVLEATQAVGFRGFVLLLASAETSADLAPLNTAERTMLADLPLGTLTVRIFLGWGGGDQPHVGWATLVCNHADVAAAAASGTFLGRVFGSTAIATSGAVLNLKRIPADEKAKHTGSAHGRHALLPQQRGLPFYRHLFEELALLHMPVARELDFVLVEGDAGVGDVVSLLFEGIANPEGHQEALGLQLQWVGAIPMQASECHSNSARHRKVEEILAAAAKKRCVRARELSRRISATDSTLQEMCQDIPVPTELPELLTSFLAKEMPDSSVAAASSTHVCLGDFDENSAVPVEEDEVCVDDIMTRAPPALRLAKACSDNGLLVAPSDSRAGSPGLYATKHFLPGDTIMIGSCAAGRWQEKTGELLTGAVGDKVLELSMVRLFRKPIQRVLVGNASCDPWVVMNNSSEANVKLVLAGGKMNDQFLVFKAAADILPFDELMWDARTPAVNSLPQAVARSAVEAVAPTVEAEVKEPAQKKLRTAGVEDGPAEECQPLADAAEGPQPFLAVEAVAPEPLASPAGSSAPPMAEAAGGEPALQKEVDAEYLQAHAKKLGELKGTPAGQAYFLAPDIYVVFTKRAKRIPAGKPLHTIFDGSVSLAAKDSRSCMQFHCPYHHPYPKHSSSTSPVP